MQYFFCDTCSLLYEGSELFNNLNFFYISNLTLKELQNIKTSNTKDPQIKWRARKLIHLLAENKDKYEIINYQNTWDEQLKRYPILSDNSDCTESKSLKSFRENSARRSSSKFM